MRKSLQSVLLAAFVLAASSAAPAFAGDTPKPAAPESAGSDALSSGAVLVTGSVVTVGEARVLLGGRK